MFDYESHFNKYCKDHNLDLVLSFNMPEGYENANGNFDVEKKAVFINADWLKDVPDYEKAFYLFHELRHTSQYLCPEEFSRAIRLSLQYVIMYDGTCYKIISGKYYECKLEGGEEYFADIYLGQPYEVDANTYAYEKVREIYGDSEELRKLYEFWSPSQPMPDDLYPSIYTQIDKEIDYN